MGCFKSKEKGFTSGAIVPEVVNYARERKKLKEQIAATWWPGVKSKLAKRLEQVEKQILMLSC